MKEQKYFFMRSAKKKRKETNENNNNIHAQMNTRKEKSCVFSYTHAMIVK